MQHLAILCFLALPLYATGFAKECWHCFSEKGGSCENPYKGRYGPNSTILMPDCTLYMARAFHATVIYVLSTASRITEIGANDTSKWADINGVPKDYDCCKSTMDVVTFDGSSESLVVRGCCHIPSVYDQCGEIENLCREMTLTMTGPNGTVNRSSCKVTYCSTCTTSSCNTANVVVESACSMISAGIVILLNGGLLNFVK